MGNVNASSSEALADYVAGLGANYSEVAGRVRADGLTLEVLKEVEIHEVFDSMQIINPVHRTRLMLEFNKHPSLGDNERPRPSPPQLSARRRDEADSLSARRRDESDLTSRYRKGEVIGHGATAVVYKGMDEATGQLVAIKEISLQTSSISSKKESSTLLDKEVRVLRRLQHPNIVGYLGAAVLATSMYIYQEWVPGGSVASILAAFGGALSPNVAAAYARHVATGLAYLHDCGVVHRDIKPANVLVTDRGVAKLSDFGTSLIMLGIPSGRSTRDQMNGGARTFVGTPLFMAPEVLRGEAYGRKADVWSFGGFVFEMLTGSPPYKDTFRSLPELIAHAVSPSKQRLQPDLSNTNLINDTNRALLSRCFCFEPADRPTAKQLLENPALADAAPHLTPRPYSFPSPTSNNDAPYNDQNHLLPHVFRRKHSSSSSMTGDGSSSSDQLSSSAFLSKPPDNERIPFSYGRTRPLSPPEPLILESLSGHHIQPTTARETPTIKTPVSSSSSKAWRHRVAISASYDDPSQLLDEEQTERQDHDDDSKIITMPSNNASDETQLKPINPYGRNANKFSRVIPTLSLRHSQQSVKFLLERRSSNSSNASSIANNSAGRTQKAQNRRSQTKSGKSTSSSPSARLKRPGGGTRKAS